MDFKDWRRALKSSEGAEREMAALALADWMDERGHANAHFVRLLAEGKKYDRVLEQIEGECCVPELNDYSWGEAFGYAGGEAHAHNQEVPSKALPNDDISVEPFGRIDVARVIAMSEGENDEQNWLIVGELHDGRFFALSAGCDYTGWD